MKIVSFVVFAFFLIIPTVGAQTQAQSAVLTLGDDARIQLIQNPDTGAGVSPLPAAESVSGGVSAILEDTYPINGAPSNTFLVTDLRFQSPSFTITFNFKACNGVLQTVGNPSNGEGQLLLISQYSGPDATTDVAVTINAASLFCSSDYPDMATVTYGGKTYRGWIQISTGMTGSVSAPGQLTQPNMTVWFGVGRALVTGSMMLDLSDYPATVVKLRQGIEPNIAPFYIDSPPWEGVPYDSYPGKTIADEGCLLTSLSMALNSTGIHYIPSTYGGPGNVLNNPQSLNAFTENTGNYDANYNINASNTISDLGLTFVAPEHYDSVTQNAQAVAFLENALAQGHPVTAGVDSDCSSGFPCHHVLVWGERNGEFLIADPWPDVGGSIEPNPPGLFTQLSQWGHYLTGGYVVDPPNLSALDVTSTDDVDLLVTTPGGALTGVDPVTGSTYQEGGAYWAESLVDALNPPAATSPSRYVDIAQPPAGPFEITVGGSTPGTFSVAVNAYAQDGSKQPAASVTGIGGPGSASTFALSYSPAIGSSPAVTRTSTPAGISSDLQNAIKAGLIKKPASLVLTLVLQGATDALKGHECLLGRAVLDLFIAAVDRYSGKGVNATVAQILVEDATSLKGSCSLKK